MGQRRTFGREFKLEAVKLVRDRGVSVAQAARDMAIRGVLTTPLPAAPVSPLNIALGQPHPLEPGGMALQPRGLAADLRHLEVPLACSRLLPLLGTPRQGQQRKYAGGPSRTHRSVPRNAARSSMAKRCEVEPCSPVAGTRHCLCRGMLAGALEELRMGGAWPPRMVGLVGWVLPIGRRTKPSSIQGSPEGWMGAPLYRSPSHPSCARAGWFGFPSIGRHPTHPP